MHMREFTLGPLSENRSAPDGRQIERVNVDEHVVKKERNNQRLYIMFTSTQNVQFSADLCGIVKTWISCPQESMIFGFNSCYRNPRRKGTEPKQEQ